MITLQKIALEVIRLESGGDQSNDSQLSEEYIVLLVRQALNTLLAPRIYEKLSQDDRSALHLMVATYTVQVEGDNPNKYLTLPDFYILLPFNKGINSIAPVEDPTDHFIPRHNPGVSRGLPCADLDPDQYSYWTKGLKVYFDEEMDLEMVLVDLVIAAPDSILKTDPLPIYPEQQAPLISMVRQLLAGQPMQDKILDNNPAIQPAQVK